MLTFIDKCIEHEKPVVVYTSCLKGAADMGIYAVGAAPLEKGAFTAGDMTLPALGQKMMYIVGVVMEEKLHGKDLFQAVNQILLTPYNRDISITERRK